MKLDAYEREILDAYKKGLIDFSEPDPEQLARFQAAAKTTLERIEEISVKLTGPDRYALEVQALDEGMPLDAFVGSVLHKFVAGRLVERPARRAATVRKAAARKAVRARP